MPEWWHLAQRGTNWRSHWRLDQLEMQSHLSFFRVNRFIWVPHSQDSKDNVKLLQLHHRRVMVQRTLLGVISVYFSHITIWPKVAKHHIPYVERIQKVKYNFQRYINPLNQSWNVLPRSLVPSLVSFSGTGAAMQGTSIDTVWGATCLGCKSQGSPSQKTSRIPRPFGGWFRIWQSQREQSCLVWPLIPKFYLKDQLMPYP